MTTLVEINNTLSTQSSSMKEMVAEQKDTNESLKSLVGKISAQMAQTERAMEFGRLQSKNQLKAKNEIRTGGILSGLKSSTDNTPNGLMDGLLKGLGVGGLAGLSGALGGTLMTLLTKGLGIIGKGAGRLLRTGLLLGAVNAWGDDLVDWVSNNLLSEPLTEADKQAAFKSLQVSAVAAGLGLGIVKSLLAGALTYMFPEQTEAAGGWMTEGMVSLLDTLGFKTEWWDKLDPSLKSQINTTLGGVVGAIVLQIGLAMLGKKILVPLAGVVAAAALTKVKDYLPNWLKNGDTIDDVLPKDPTAKPGMKRVRGTGKGAAKALKAADAAAEAAQAAGKGGTRANPARAIRLADSVTAAAQAAGQGGTRAAARAGLRAERAAQRAADIQAAAMQAAGRGGSRANPSRAAKAKAAKLAAQAAEGAAELAKFGNRARLNRLGFSRNANGALINATTKKIASVDELTKAILVEKAAKAAKYSKFLKVVGPLGALVDLTDPLVAIYTDQPEDVIKKELAGSLGSLSGAYLGMVAGGAAVTLIPVVGQSGFGNILGMVGGAIAGSFAGEYTAESLANFLLGGKEPKPATPVKYGLGTYTELGAGEMNPFGTGNSFTNGRRDRQKSRAAAGAKAGSTFKRYGLGTYAELGTGEMNPFGTGNIYTNGPAPIPAKVAEEQKEERSWLSRWWNGDESTPSPTGNEPVVAAGNVTILAKTGVTTLTKNLLEQEGKATAAAIQQYDDAILRASRQVVVDAKTINNVSNSSNTGITIPPQPVADILDGGFALGRSGPF